MTECHRKFVLVIIFCYRSCCAAWYKLIKTGQNSPKFIVGILSTDVGTVYYHDVCVYIFSLSEKNFFGDFSLLILGGFGFYVNY